MNDTMELTTGLSSEDYQHQVANALAFLPAEDREEILAGVGEHLREVSAEGIDLVERLGTPEAYARELTAAAGLGSASPRQPSSRAALARLRAHRFGRQVADFVPMLQPAWWVLRGYFAVVALAVLLNSGPDLDWWQLVVAWPRLGSLEGIVTVGLVLVAVIVSIALGRRSLGKAQRVIVVLANVAVVALAALALSNGNRVDEPYVEPSVRSVDQGGLRQDGDPILNIFAFDADGRPLTDVRLYDQEGNPIYVKPGIERRLLEPSVDKQGEEYINNFPYTAERRGGKPIPRYLQTDPRYSGYEGENLVDIPPLTEPTKKLLAIN